MSVRRETASGEPAEDRAGEGTPSFGGPLDQILGTAPVFRSRMRGYEPMEVDTYVAWAESELRTVRRQVDDLLGRFGACSAELEISRRMLADSPRNSRVFPVSERVEEMLRLAGEEATALTEAAAREAEHLVAEARSEADARLRKAHEIKEMAVRSADELRDHARRQQAEAQAKLDRADEEAAGLLRAAAQERERLAAEAAREREHLAAQAALELEQAAAAAALGLAELQEQVADLRRQRDEARQSLRALSSRIGEALQAVVAPVPDPVVEPNVAMEGMEFDAASVAVPVTAEVPAPGAGGDQRGEDVVVVRRPAPMSS